MTTSPFSLAECRHRLLQARHAQRILEIKVVGGVLGQQLACEITSLNGTRMVRVRVRSSRARPRRLSEDQANLVDVPVVDDPITSDRTVDLLRSISDMVQPRGAYMINATPMRQTAAPTISQRSGRNPSTMTPHPSEPATNTPP